jgi:hypothetical protein
MDELMRTANPHLSYIPLNAEYDSVSKIFADSYDSSEYCISALFRVDNPILRHGSDKCVTDITERRGVMPEVRRMFHGTTLAAVHSIADYGFDPLYSRTAAYGRGTYASPSVKFALNYCKDVSTIDDFSMVFLCDFILGTYGLTPSGGAIDSSLMDYCGNKTNIFVTPYKYGIVPKYLICFYKWAT